VSFHQNVPGVPGSRVEVPPLPAGLDGRDADPGPGRVCAPFVPGMPRLGTGPAPGRGMTGTDDAAGADRERGPGPQYLVSAVMALGGWPALYAAPRIPFWMGADLERLRAAFPAYSFGICRGWRGLAFEAWSDAGTGGLYAVITQDAGELWRELEEGQDGVRPRLSA
jgi:hypothetical protein